MRELKDRGTGWERKVRRARRTFLPLFKTLHAGEALTLTPAGELAYATRDDFVLMCCVCCERKGTVFPAFPAGFLLHPRVYCAECAPL